MTLDVKKFALSLREIGVRDLGFHTRKKLCNIAYLLTVFGIDIGLPLSSFKWYLHGVYHTEITELKHQLAKRESEPQ